MRPRPTRPDVPPNAYYHSIPSALPWLRRSSRPKRVQEMFRLLRMPAVPSTTPPSPSACLRAYCVSNERSNVTANLPVPAAPKLEPNVYQLHLFHDSDVADFPNVNSWIACAIMRSYCGNTKLASSLCILVVQSMGVPSQRHAQAVTRKECKRQLVIWS
jgi:hypothetical protein